MRLDAVALERLGQLVQSIDIVIGKRELERAVALVDDVVAAVGAEA